MTEPLHTFTEADIQKFLHEAGTFSGRNLVIRSECDLRKEKICPQQGKSHPDCSECIFAAQDHEMTALLFQREDMRVRRNPEFRKIPSGCRQSDYYLFNGTATIKNETGNIIFHFRNFT